MLFFSEVVFVFLQPNAVYAINEFKSKPLNFRNNLPVLHAIINKIMYSYSLRLDNVIFVCVQHLLYTTLDLLDALVTLGANPKNIHIMGKPYSNCQEVINKITANRYIYYPNSQQEGIGSFMEHFKHDIQQMWEKITCSLSNNKIQSIIVLDDGGCCISMTPKIIQKNYPIFGIEQTSSGLTRIINSQVQFPVIEVASSAIKQTLESPMIADAVVRKIEHLLPITKQKVCCAVIGLGVIGIAITKKLLSLGHTVITYDHNIHKNITINHAISYNNLNKLIYDASYIFGCSGYDVTNNLDFCLIEANKCFISCSSHDQEFLSLIRHIQQEYAYQNFNGHISCQFKNGANIKILARGYPINFDNSGESVPAQNIQLTRGLLLGGVLQAVLSLPHSTTNAFRRHMLAPTIQQFVVANWLAYGSTQFVNHPFFSYFTNLYWIAENSGGCYHENKIINLIFKSHAITDIN